MRRACRFWSLTVISGICVLTQHVRKRLGEVIFLSFLTRRRQHPKWSVPGGCRLRMAASAIYLCLGTWFLLNLIASFSALKSREASKQGQHPFNLITLHCSLRVDPWLPRALTGPPIRTSPATLGAHRRRGRAQAPNLTLHRPHLNRTPDLAFYALSDVFIFHLPLKPCRLFN